MKHRIILYSLISILFYQFSNALFKKKGHGQYEKTPAISHVFKNSDSLIVEITVADENMNGCLTEELQQSIHLISRGGKISILPGKYIVSAITIGKPITVTSEGRCELILDTLQDFPEIFVLRSDSIVISNLILNGNKRIKEYRFGNRAIIFAAKLLSQPIHFLSIRNNIIRNSGKGGIHIGGGRFCRIENNIIDSCFISASKLGLGSGIELTDVGDDGNVIGNGLIPSTDNIVSGNIIKNPRSGHGAGIIAFYSPCRNIISNNKINGFREIQDGILDAVSITVGRRGSKGIVSDGNVVENNIVDAWISVDNTENCLVSNNIVEIIDQSKIGIEVVWSKNCTVQDNTIRFAKNMTAVSQTAISVDGSQYCIIKNNKITGSNNAQDGSGTGAVIFVGSNTTINEASSNISILDNIITDSKEIGIVVFGNSRLICKNIEIRGNQIKECKKGGMFLSYNSNILVYENTIIPSIILNEKNIYYSNIAISNYQASDASSPGRVFSNTLQSANCKIDVFDSAPIYFGDLELAQMVINKN